MSAVKAKELHFEVGLDAYGRAAASRTARRSRYRSGWTAEHLLLAALVRCSLESLRYVARRMGIEVSETSGAASAVGDAPRKRRPLRGRQRRGRTGGHARTEADHRRADRAARAAERGCFIGTSLAAKPSYRWNIT